MRDNPISDLSLEHLVKMKTLRELEIRQTKVTQAGVSKFKEQRPDVRVVSDVEK